MKKIVLSNGSRCAMMALILSASPTAFGDQPPSTKDIILKEYRLGEAAALQGDFATARKHFNAVLKKAPNHAYARRNLAKMRLAEKQLAEKGPDLKAQLENVFLESVELNQAKLSEVVSYLVKRVEDETAGKLKLNLVVHPSLPQDIEITLSLRNVPVTAVLQYIGDLGNLEWHYDNYVVVARPFSEGDEEPTLVDEVE